MLKGTLTLAASLAAGLVFITTACQSMATGFKEGECKGTAHDQDACTSCCKAANPAGQGGHMKFNQCFCIDAQGRDIP
jgi:hypothetical protein